MFDAAASLCEEVDVERAGILSIAQPAVDSLGLSALLVRPDGIVAWASDGADAAGLAQALREWMGPVGREAIA
ncbi:hypothetical protein D3C73_1047740 [compost metagenome]